MKGKFFQEILAGNYELAVWTGTTYERYFRSAQVSTLPGRFWSDVIKGTPNQVKSNTAGVKIMFEVTLKVILQYSHRKD